MVGPLDFSSRARPALDFSGRARRPALNRSMGERARDNIGDGARRSGLGAVSRAADPGADGLFNLRDLTAVRPGSIADRVLDRTVGTEREWFAAGDDVPSARQVLAGQGLRDRPAAIQETDRRARYAERAAEDPIRNAGDAIAYFAGQVIGGAPSPENWIGGGALAPARTTATSGARAALDFAARATGRVAEQAAIAGGTDVALQMGDIAAGIEDRYQPLQTGVSALVGGTVGGAVDIAAPAVRRGAARGLDFSGRAVQGARDRLRAVADNPVPEFTGPAMDAGRPQAAFVPPVQGRVSSGFGPRQRPNARASANHMGLDYAVPEGTSVAAAADGEVIFAGRRGNYGNRVEIRHADGSESSYSHLADFGVKVGDRVSSGQSVARSGSTGNVTGPHLHFEIRRDGAFVDPRSVLSGEAASSAAPRRARLALTPGDLAAPETGSVRSLSPEQRAMVDRAVKNPARLRDVQAMFAEEGMAPRDARNAARSTVHRARQARQVETSAGPDFSSRARAASEPETNTTPRLDVAPLDFSPRARVGAEADRLAIDLSGYADRLGQPLPSSGQSPSGLREAPRPGAVERGGGAAYEGLTVSDLAADLRSALGLTHRQGRVSTKRALGEYDTGSGVVRTKAVDEIDVLAHEATHALEFEIAGHQVRSALKAHAGELEALAYPGAAPGVKREEGFAEFGRWYLTNPDHARRVAPRFYEAFEMAMETDAPAALQSMRAVQDGYQNLLKSSSIDVAKASIAYTGNGGVIGTLRDAIRRRGPGSVARQVMDRLYTWFVDDLNPIAVTEREMARLYLANTGQRLDLARSQSPDALARLSRDAYAAGHNDLMNGVVPYRGLDPSGPSLADALETAELGKTVTGKLKNDGLREFDAYLIARRMIHEWDRYAKGELPNPPDRNTRQFHEQVIADAERAHPTWATAAGQVYGFLENLWRKEFDAGLIARETYDNGLTAHPDYVPLMRDMSDKGPGRGGKPRGALQFAGGAKAFEGSSRDIISPLSSIMRRAYELNAIVRRNDVMKALDDLAQGAGRGSGSLVERLPAKEIESVTINAQQALQKAADEMGLSGRDLSTMQKFADDAAAQDTTLQLFKQAEFSPRKGEAVVFVWRDGKKMPLLLADGEFGQEMYRALTGLTPDMSNVAVDIASAGTQMLRYGVTLSPEFMGANLVRDAVATWINTDVGFVPGLDTVRGGVSEVSQDTMAKRYAVAGGMRGGANVAATAKPFPRSDAEASAQLQHLRRKGWKVKRYASWRGLAELTDLSETSTRLGVFRKAFDQAKARGLDDYDALIESGFLSRDYLDFGRRGSRMMTASRLVTFLNAALQGMDKSGRVLSAEGRLKRLLTEGMKTEGDQRLAAHAATAWAKIGVLGAIGLGLRALYAGDPEYQEINDRLRATHWIARINGAWVFVPKPFELATLSNALERTLEGVYLKDPTAGERFVSDLTHTVAPPSEIPALAVPFHLAKNRDYLGRPIVPDHLKGTVDPQHQVAAYTSDLGKLIGKAFGISPAQVDYVVTGFGGSLGRYLLQGSNLVGEAVTGRPATEAGPEDMFLSRRFIRQISRGSESQRKFWDEVSRDGGSLTRAEGTFRSFLRDSGDEEGAAYLNNLPDHQRAYVAVKVFGQPGESKLHPMARAQAVVSLLGDFREAVRDGSLRDASGATISLTPGQRRTIDSAVADFALAEMRGALIDTGSRGWGQKRKIDPKDAVTRVGRASPAAFEALQSWLNNERLPTVLHPEQRASAEATWNERRPLYEDRRPLDEIVRYMRRERSAEGSRRARYQESLRVRGGQYDGALDFSSRSRAL